MQAETSVDFADLIEWYRSQCDDSWEHQHGTSSTLSTTPASHAKRDHRLTMRSSERRIASIVFFIALCPPSLSLGR